MDPLVTNVLVASAVLPVEEKYAFLPPIDGAVPFQYLWPFLDGKALISISTYHSPGELFVSDDAAQKLGFFSEECSGHIEQSEGEEVVEEVEVEVEEVAEVEEEARKK